MKPAAPTPTMRDLAARLGLSVMTVSRALRNAAGVGAKTRAQVLAAAKRHGYRPDPVLAVLNAYRHGRRVVARDETVAFLSNFPEEEAWRNSGTFVRYFNGLRARGAQLGYRIEPFWLGEKGLTPRRASQILHGRGVKGVIVGPLVQGSTQLELDWPKFSAVALGRSLLAPGLTTASINHFQVIETAWAELWRRGFRRIGLALRHSEDVRTMGLLRASFALQQARVGEAAVPVFFTRDFDGPGIAAWVETHRPEVILTSEQKHYELLLATRGFDRRKVGFVHLNVEPQAEPCGIDQGHELVGEHALALLHLKLIQRETGVPPRRDVLLVEGAWKEGRGEWRLPIPDAAPKRRKQA